MCFHHAAKDHMSLCFSLGDRHCFLNSMHLSLGMLSVQGSEGYITISHIYIWLKPWPKGTPGFQILTSSCGDDYVERPTISVFESKDNGRVWKPYRNSVIKFSISHTHGCYSCAHLFQSLPRTSDRHTYVAPSATPCNTPVCFWQVSALPVCGLLARRGNGRAISLALLFI